MADGLFSLASEKSDSDLADRVESVFNISFWAKEGAIDWAWLGLDPEKERKADELVLALEWQCYREAERQMIDCFLDMPWTCSMATLRMLQMRELTDKGRLELPGQCPWCDSKVAVKGFSLYTQLWNYADHVMKSASCVASYIVELDALNQPKGQIAPLTRTLLSDADRKKAEAFHSDYAVVYLSVKGHRRFPWDSR